MAKFTLEMANELADKIIEGNVNGNIVVLRGSLVGFVTGGRELLGKVQVGKDAKVPVEDVQRINIEKYRNKKGKVLKHLLAEYLYKRVNTILAKQDNRIQLMKDIYRRQEKVNNTKSKTTINEKHKEDELEL